jgi:hypothetical protein
LEETALGVWLEEADLVSVLRTGGEGFGVALRVATGGRECEMVGKEEFEVEDNEEGVQVVV